MIRLWANNIVSLLDDKNWCLRTVKALARVKRTCLLSNHGNNNRIVVTFQSFHFSYSKSALYGIILAEHHHCRWPPKWWARTCEWSWSCCEGISQLCPSLQVRRFYRDLRHCQDTVALLRMLSWCWRLLVQVMSANVHSTRRPQLVALLQTFHKNTFRRLVEQGLTSHSTQFRSFRRRCFYRSDDPTNSVNLARLISPCYNNTTCMHIQDTRQ